MDFGSGRCTAKRMLIAAMLLITCPRTTHAVNPITMLGNNTISFSAVKNLGYGLGALASVCLFEHCLKKWDDALGRWIFSMFDTPGVRRQNEVSCNRWLGASVGCAATAIVGSALLCRNILSDEVLKSDTISMAAAKSAGFGLLYCLSASWLLKKWNAKYYKRFGRVALALVGGLAVGGAALLSLANARNCIQLIAGKR